VAERRKERKQLDVQKKDKKDKEGYECQNEKQQAKPNV